MTKQFRRIVTGLDNHGRSVVRSDEVVAPIGYLHELWESGPLPAILNPAELPVADKARIKIWPDAGGSIFRFVEIPPDSIHGDIDPETRKARVRESFAKIGSASAIVDQTRHPSMHQTETLDYIIVLSGRLTMLLEEGEVELKPFDVVIQQGTNHAWVNKQEESAWLAAVLVDGKNPSSD